MYGVSTDAIKPVLMKRSRRSGYGARHGVGNADPLHRDRGLVAYFIIAIHDRDIMYDRARPR